MVKQYVEVYCQKEEYQAHTTPKHLWTTMHNIHFQKDVIAPGYSVTTSLLAVTNLLES